MKVVRVLLAAALGIALLAPTGFAQDVLFDFEGLHEGPVIDPPFPIGPYVEVIDPGTGLVIRISRLGAGAPLPPPLPPLPFLQIANLAGRGAPPGFGSRTLSPFLDPTQGTQIQIDFFPPPGLGVERVTWEQGDAFPSDLDTYFTTTYTDFGTPPSLFHERGIDDSGFLPPFGVSVGSVQRTHAITRLWLRGGSPDFPNSLYFDNFVVTLSPVDGLTGQFAAGTDSPGSDPGGDPFSDSAGGDGGLPDNAPPEVVALDNIVILSEDQGTTVLTATATDPETDPMTFSWFEETPGGDVPVFGPAAVGAGGEADLPLSAVAALAVGDHSFRVDVTDGISTTSDHTMVTIDNTPPEASPDGGGVFDLDGPAIALDADVLDFDGDLLTYEWRWNGSPLAPIPAGVIQAPGNDTSIALPTESVLPTTLGLGTHTLELAVDDGINTEVVASIQVEVVDTTAPRLCPRATPRLLYPPNHKMRCVTVHARASDNAGGPLTYSVDVQIERGRRCFVDRHFDPDVEIVSIDDATGTIELKLRAERNALGRGRTYRIHVTATDESGNSSTATARVSVPAGRVWRFSRRGGGH